MELFSKGIPPLRIPKLGKKSQEREDEIENYMRIICDGMIGNITYIGTSLNGLIQEEKSKGKNPFQFLQFFYINKGDRTSYWVVHSKIKELDTNYLFEKKYD